MNVQPPFKPAIVAYRSSILTQVLNKKAKRHFFHNFGEAIRTMQPKIVMAAEIPEDVFEEKEKRFKVQNLKFKVQDLRFKIQDLKSFEQP
jgi:hypothetical protein